MLTKQNYQTLLTEIKEKTDIIQDNLYKSFINACTRYTNLEYRTYIQFNEDGEITNIFNGGYKPDVPKNLDRNDTICIDALKDLTDRCDEIFFQREKQIEEELRKEYSEKLNEIDTEDETAVTNLLKEYHDILSARVFEAGFISGRALIATYDIETTFNNLYQYLENEIKNMD